MSGPVLVEELFTDDWALRRFAGVSNLPAVPQALTAQELAPYEGVYTQQSVGAVGELETTQFHLAAADGQLAVTWEGEPVARLAFYRPDYVLILGPAGEPGSARANFVRGAAGRVDWLRFGGRLARREATSAVAPDLSTRRTSENPFRREAFAL